MYNPVSDLNTSSHECLSVLYFPIFSSPLLSSRSLSPLSSLILNLQSNKNEEAHNTSQDDMFKSFVSLKPPFLMLIYCSYESIVAKLITVKISHCIEPESIFLVPVIHLSY
jgi:hypothetical protein